MIVKTDWIPNSSRERAFSSAPFLGGIGLSSLLAVLLLLACAAWATPEANAERLVVLGDSYASGEGAGSYDLGTDTRGDRCHRSPYAWGRLLGVTTVDLLACSGARVEHLSVGKSEEPPDDVGQLVRLAYINHAAPISAIAITLGGNDIHFADRIRDCFLGRCLNNLPAIRDDLDKLQRNLKKSYESIQTIAAGVRLIVVGYPDILPSPSESDRCLWLSGGAKDRALTLEAELNETIEKAAQAAGADFVSVRDVLDGHELCTKDSWMRPIGSASSGSIQEMAHPDPIGQLAIAARLQNRILPLAPAPTRLGSPYYLSGSQQGAGWGEIKPGLISNGGVPSGILRDVRWRNWGQPSATAIAKNAIYKPSGNYYGSVRVPLRASNAGTCPGESGTAYRTLQFRIPNWPGGPLGPWLKWSGSETLCDSSVTDPDYEYPHRPPGVCGYLGDDYGAPGNATDIMAFNVSCHQAREAARASARVSSKCARRGCHSKLAGLQCTLQRIHWDTDVTYDGIPVQRVACGNDSKGASWFMPRFFD